MPKKPKAKCFRKTSWWKEKKKASKANVGEQHTAAIDTNTIPNVFVVDHESEQVVEFTTGIHASPSSENEVFDISESLQVSGTVI